MVQLCLLNKLGELYVLLASLILHLQFISFIEQNVFNVNKNQAGINLTQKNSELAPSSPPQFNTRPAHTVTTVPGSASQLRF